jgi:hypothetical protein
MVGFTLWDPDSVIFEFSISWCRRVAAVRTPAISTMGISGMWRLRRENRVEINENGLIYEIQMENGVEVARFIKCAFLRLDICCPDTVAVNQELNVTIAYLGLRG